MTEHDHLVVPGSHVDWDKVFHHVFLRGEDFVLEMAMKYDGHFADLLLSAYVNWQERMKIHRVSFDRIESTVTNTEEKLPIGRLVRGVDAAHTAFHPLDQSGLTDFVKDRASKLSGGNVMFLEDCLQIVDHLRLYTVGRWTKKLPERKVHIDGRKYPLMRVDPRWIPRLRQGHKALSDLRVVYALIRLNGNKAVGIQGFYSHKDYESIFRSKSH